MTTTKKPLKYIFVARFTDGHVIVQPTDDRYSKHDDSAEHNPSAYTDVLEYDGDIESFELHSKEAKVFSIKLDKGEKLVYYRNVDQHNINGEWSDPFVSEYCVGYEYTDSNNKKHEKVITIYG